MGVTSIEWADHSINPIRARHRPSGAVGHYCEKISGGCSHCYASGLQRRFRMAEFPPVGSAQTNEPGPDGTVPLLGEIDLTPYLPGLQWVIVGGESGPGARRCDVAWVRRIVGQCQRSGVPVFVKQLGARPTSYGGDWKLRDRKGGDPSEWPDDLRVRQFPADQPPRR